MKTITLSFLLLTFSFIGNAQQTQEAETNTGGVNGQFGLGMRTTWSVFGESDNTGLGYGGQFRIRAGKRLNTEWYADYIKTELNGLGNRETGHIGWSVMFYPLNTEIKKGAFTPYFLAGHCFDYAKVSTNQYWHWDTKTYDSEYEERWTSAVQLGIGSSYYITDKIDISLSAQYMSHLGNDIHTETATGEYKKDDGSIETFEYLKIDNSKKSLTLEGHLLVTMSLNIRLFDLIKKS